MNQALTSVFGCRHERMSRIFTIGDESYMACLECGHRVYYSITAMRRMTRREVRQMRQELLAGPRPAAAEARASGPTLAA